MDDFRLFHHRKRRDFHDLRTDSRHLRAVFGRFDRGEQIAAEGGASLEEEARFRLDGQLRAVGRQARMELDGAARQEGAADGGRAAQQDVRIVFPDKIRENRLVAAVVVVLQQRMVRGDDLRGANGGGFADGGVQIMPDQDGGHLRVRRQPACAGYQFKRHL